MELPGFDTNETTVNCNTYKVMNMNTMLKVIHKQRSWVESHRTAVYSKLLSSWLFVIRQDKWRKKIPDDTDIIIILHYGVHWKFKPPPNSEVD
jgi:hypothetical protein